MSGNQRNQSMKKNYLRLESVPKVKIKTHPFEVDPLMIGDYQLDNCCVMKDYQLVIKPKVQEWLEEENINVKFSVYFGMFYFQSDEERVMFILKWL